MDCYMGTILPFAFNFAPSYFDFCNGQQYRVSQYQALFALLGKFYGGDGATTFNLPNLQGRMLLVSVSYKRLFITWAILVALPMFSCRPQICRHTRIPPLYR
jgi:microcystin-dependent protein